VWFLMNRRTRTPRLASFSLEATTWRARGFGSDCNRVGDCCAPPFHAVRSILGLRERDAMNSKTRAQPMYYPLFFFLSGFPSFLSPSFLPSFFFVGVAGGNPKIQEEGPV
jgi:hypothetical protein